MIMIIIMINCSEDGEVIDEEMNIDKKIIILMS